MRVALAIAVFGLLFACRTYAQQISDPNADVTVANPAYGEGAGPLVLVDAAHNNYHTIANRFSPFAALLRNDGFRVEANNRLFDAAAFRGAKVLVIANALNVVNDEHWVLPTPSAFTPQEITAVKAWVNAGGALLLIADHMPFAGAASDLGAAFGFAFINGFALHAPYPLAIDFFSRADHTLKDDPLTRGFTKIATFTGSAFSPPAAARPLLVFSDDYLMLLPSVAWEFNDQTRTQEAQGLAQGAVTAAGKGRLGVFGEAGMFTAQIATGPSAIHKYVGFNAPEAPENRAFILTLMHWLAGGPAK
jgi:hypothetical protein